MVNLVFFPGHISPVGGGFDRHSGRWIKSHKTHGSLHSGFRFPFSFSSLFVSVDFKYTTFGGADPQNQIQGQLRQIHRECARLPLCQVEGLPPHARSSYWSRAMLPFLLWSSLPSFFESVWYNVIPAVFTYTRKPAATFFGTNFCEPQMVDSTKEGGVTVVLRVVRSFPHRNIRPLVLKDVSLSLTAQQVKI